MAIPEFVAELRRHVGTAPLILPSVVAVVLDDRGRVLMTQRSDDHRWALVSGCLDPGEQPAAGAVREIMEETGVEAVVERLLSAEAMGLRRLPNGDQVYWFEIGLCCRAVGGSARVNDDESIDVAWFAPEQIPALDAHQTRYLELARKPDGAPYFTT